GEALEFATAATLHRRPCSLHQSHLPVLAQRTVPSPMERDGSGLGGGVPCQCAAEASPWGRALSPRSQNLCPGTAPALASPPRSVCPAGQAWKIFPGDPTKSA